MSWVAASTKVDPDCHTCAYDQDLGVAGIVVVGIHQGRVGVVVVNDTEGTVEGTLSLTDSRGSCPSPGAWRVAIGQLELREGGRRANEAGGGKRGLHDC